MNKDIIYIDTEDDITSIIGRIKASKDKIIALVPPKRIGVLQSAVNLRLLARTAKLEHKHLVIITNNKALSALTAIAQIPVARNLQSRPEIADIAAIEVDEDVIDGANLPIGELAKTVKGGPTAEVTTVTAGAVKLVKTHDSTRDDDSNSVEAAIDDIDIEDDDEEILMQPSNNDEKPNVDKPITSGLKKDRSGVKIPNFSSFRKRLFFGAILFAMIIGFGVWALNFAPAATVTITAKTTKAPISVSVTLIDAATDTTKRTIQTITKTLKKDLSVDFTATGNEKRGDKATGTLTLSARKGYAIQVLAGTVFSNGDYDFVTNTTVDVPKATTDLDMNVIPGTITVGITATEIGTEYNLAAGNYVSDIENVTATGTATAGGSSHDATVVTNSDLEKANTALNELSTSSMKTQVLALFTSGEYIIDSSYNLNYSAPVSLPALDGELLAGKAKLSTTVTATVVAISKADVLAYLKDNLNKQLDAGDKIYDDGSSTVKLTGYSKNETTAIVNIEAIGKIGPDIDTNKVKSQVIGKRFGDIQSTLSSIDGVNSVDTKFSYFWVNTVPNDTKKITVEFKIQNE